ncbi:TRASH domain-containing protein [Kribbella sp. NPDC026596]|uniref:TRASH domain-containing protein n=1 Tax=Kribbella sp. NPDC026596 TaxID=3155122 RepID=UPI003403203B
MMGSQDDADARPAADADTAVDPVCGMTVQLFGTPITLVHNDATYAFCCAGCRNVFAERASASRSRVGD